MSDLVSLFCPHCNQVSAAPADALVRGAACAICGKMIQAVRSPMPQRSVPPFADRRLPRRMPSWAWAALVGVALGLILGEIVYLQRRRARQVAARADEVVAAQIEAAQAHAARGDWDEAIRALEEALATEQAPMREQARPLLLQARQGQARALLDNARAAIGTRNVPRAFTLLRAYRAHPQAPDQGLAARLEAELQRATTASTAADRLARMTEEELARFATHGQTAKAEGIADPGVHLIFLDTLRRQLPREQVRRAAARRAARMEAARRSITAARREARLRATPAFRELTAFVADSRARLRELKESAEEQAEAMEQFFEQTGVSDPDERERLRRRLREGEAGADTLVAAVRRKGKQAKRAFRRGARGARGDAEVFDQLVDREVEGLRQEAQARE